MFKGVSDGFGVFLMSFKDMRNEVKGQPDLNIIFGPKVKFVRGNFIFDNELSKFCVTGKEILILWDKLSLCVLF